jgi:hypothetical protein
MIAAAPQAFPTRSQSDIRTPDARWPGLEGARRAPNPSTGHVLACFVLGLSTCKIATALLPALGRPVSPAAVSGGGEAARCRGRRLPSGGRSGPVSGAVPGQRGSQAQGRRRRSGGGPTAGKRVASAEIPRRQWERFPGATWCVAGRSSERLELLCGRRWLRTCARPSCAFPETPVQRRWAPKIRNER